MKTIRILRAAIVAALYVVLTYFLPSLAYGPIQFRFSEIMTLLAYLDPFYILPLTLGCALVNIGSPLGLVDVFFGSFSSFLALFAMSKTKNIYLASLWPSFFSIMIGLEIFLLSEAPISFFLVSGQIMFSQFIIVTLIGVPVFQLIQKNAYLIDLLKDN